MNGDVVISVKNVSKCFEMYEKPVHRLYQTLCAGKKKFYKEFWALKDIDLEVRRGECVGIIGRNGAGKSTLLQIITGTLAPTSGAVDIKGRVAALLELGSGFNPEFTGRENVYLNAAILGLTREETDARFAEIEGFADIGDFINQPVKTYSSGMMVRLAFAVNAFVEPDVLIVDEALAVGDVAFQYKCYQKMRSILADKNKVVVFVTHDMSTVKTFCTRVYWLNRGCVEAVGSPLQIVERYLAYMCGSASPPTQGTKPEPSQTEERGEADVLLPVLPSALSNGAGGAEITHVGLFDENGRRLQQVSGTQRVRLLFRFKAEAEIETPLVAFHLTDRKGTSILGSNNTVTEDTFEAIPAGASRLVTFEFTLPELQNDEYLFLLAVNSFKNGVITRLHNVVNGYKLTFSSSSSYQKQGVLVKLPDCKISVSG